MYNSFEHPGYKDSGFSLSEINVYEGYSELLAILKGESYFNEKELSINNYTLYTK
jgi:hypothetical protein